jgi:O-antigen/teichoic acid export membrane protein
VTVTIYVPFFALVFDAGITTLAVRTLSTAPDRVDEFRDALGLRIALSLPVAALAFGLAWAIYGDDQSIRNGIAVALPIIPLASVTSTMTALFQARLEMDRPALAEITGQLVTAALIVALVAADAPLEAIFAAVVAGAGVNLVVVILFSRRIGNARPLLRPRTWIVLLRRALPLGLALMIATVYFRADAFLLSILKGPHAVGIYGVAYRLLEAVIAFPGFFYVSIFPLLAQAYARRDFDNLREVTQRAFDVLVIAAVPVVFGTLAIAPQIVHALAGKGFGDAVTPLRIVILGAGFTFVNGLLSYLLIALDRQVIVLATTVATLLFNLALNLALIPPYSYTAAAAAATASELLTLAVMFVLARRFAGFVPRLEVSLKAVAAGVAIVAALLVTPGILAVQLVVGAAVYAIALLLLRTHRSLELRELLRPGRSAAG